MAGYSMEHSRYCYDINSDLCRRLNRFVLNDFIVIEIFTALGVSFSIYPLLRLTVFRAHH